MEIKGKVHCFFEQSKEEWRDIKGFEGLYQVRKVAAESLGIHKEQISAVCRKQRKTAGGYNWRYAL